MNTLPILELQTVFFEVAGSSSLDDLVSIFHYLSIGQTYTFHISSITKRPLNRQTLSHNCTHMIQELDRRTTF